MSEGLAVKWYIPAQVSVLRTLYPFVLLSSLLGLGLNALRGGQGTGWFLASTLANLALWAMLHRIDRGQRGVRDALILVAGAATVTPVLAFIEGPKLWVDAWLTAWSVLPAVYAMNTASSPLVALWTSGRMDRKQAELGLWRNRRTLPTASNNLRHLALLHACAAVILPLVWVLDVALSPGNALGGAFLDAITFEHFSRLLSSDSFWLWARNSIIVAVGTTLLGLALAVPAGYAFSRYRFRGREMAMFAFLLVQMFPGVIILVPYFLVMKALGLLNTSLGLILAYSVTALPLCVWMLKGFFDTVPRELEEAALVDGCSQTEVFWRIVLPLSLPAVAVTALFSFLAAWNEFLLALTFNTSEDMYTLPVGLASLISSTGQAWGDFAAASLLVSLPVVLLFIVFQRFLIQGLSAGGVKG